MEEKLGGKCIQAEGELGEILAIIRCKIVGRGFSFYHLPGLHAMLCWRGQGAPYISFVRFQITPPVLAI